LFGNMKLYIVDYLKGLTVDLDDFDKGIWTIPAINPGSCVEKVCNFENVYDATFVEGNVNNSANGVTVTV